MVDGVTGHEAQGYLPPRPGPGKRHPVRNPLLVLGVAVVAGFVIGWRLGR